MEQIASLRASRTRSKRWKSPRCGVAAAACLIASLSPGAAQARSPSCDVPLRHTLANGIQVTLVADPVLPAVAVVSSVHVGSRHDPPGYEGLAHYVEHLTFRPAPRFAPVFDLYAEAAAFGVNATTSLDTTDYYAIVPAAQVERALWIEARRLALGLDALEEAPALDERRVLQREHELRYGKGPLLPIVSATYAALYPEQHPYHPPFNTPSSIERLTLSAARWFFARYYRPERVRIALVGDFQAEQVKRLLDRDFGSLAARGGAAPAPAQDECRWSQGAARPSSKRLRLRSLSQNERLELLWPVQQKEPDELRAVFGVLTGELSAALSQVGLSHDVRGELVRNELGSFWQIAIDVMPGQPFEKVEPLVRKVVSALRESFMNESDLAANRQAVELTELQTEMALLRRAARLVRRECVPSSCVDLAEQLSPAAVSQLDHFDVSRALAVEWRFDRNAELGGEIERLP